MWITIKHNNNNINSAIAFIIDQRKSFFVVVAMNTDISKQF